MLLTGFEPFGRWRVNSSWEGARLAARRFGPRVRLTRLPVDHALAAERLRAELAAQRPSICLLTGLAAGGRVRLERLARRERFIDLPEDASWPDGPAERRGAWRWGAARSRIAAIGPCAFSEDAGLYVCESAYRALLDWRAETGRPRAAAFLHVPPLSRAWPPERIARAIEAALAAMM